MREREGTLLTDSVSNTIFTTSTSNQNIMEVARYISYVLINYKMRELEFTIKKYFNPNRKNYQK